eukprot:2192534-Amphidinium_carterae.1
MWQAGGRGEISLKVLVRVTSRICGECVRKFEIKLSVWMSNMDDNATSMDDRQLQVRSPPGVDMCKCSVSIFPCASCGMPSANWTRATLARFRKISSR